MSEHEASICPKRAVLCTNEGCTALMPESMIAAHKANDCLYEVVDCPFKSVGCQENVVRKDANNHADTATNQHMLLLLQCNQCSVSSFLKFFQCAQPMMISVP